MKSAVQFACILAFLPIAALASMPHGSFLVQHVNSTTSLVEQFDHNPRVRLHFRKALHLSDSQIRQILSQLRIKRLTQDHVYPVGFYRSNGTWGFKNLRLRKGSRIFVTPLGIPFLVLECGNPIQQPPVHDAPPLEAPPLPPLVYLPPELIPPIDLTPPVAGLPPAEELPPLTTLSPPDVDIPPDLLPPSLGIFPPEEGGWPPIHIRGSFPWWLALLGVPFLFHGGGGNPGGSPSLPPPVVPPVVPPPVIVPPVVPPPVVIPPVPEPGSMAVWGALLGVGAGWLWIKRSRIS